MFVYKESVRFFLSPVKLYIDALRQICCFMGDVRVRVECLFGSIKRVDVTSLVICA